LKTCWQVIEGSPRQGVSVGIDTHITRLSDLEPASIYKEEDMQRYKHCPEYDFCPRDCDPMVECNNGNFVLYSDHQAAIEAKDHAIKASIEQIVTTGKDLTAAREQIARLTASDKRLREALERRPVNCDPFHIISG
jgi:hypothetical protein